MSKEYDIAAELEGIVDALGVTGTLDALSTICQEKAEHIRVNWQDRALSGQWVRLARLIRGAATKSGKIPTS